MAKNNYYASLGKLLLLRLAVAASVAAYVWAHREESDEHHHHHGDHDRGGDETSSAVIMILKFYAIVTGVAFLLMALAGIAFACGFYCLRCGKGKSKSNKGDSGAITNNNDGCELGPQKVGCIICATLCWPVVVVGFGCTMLFKLGAVTTRRCKSIKRQKSNSKVGGGCLAKEATVGDSSKISWDIFEITPPVSIVEEGDTDSIKLELV